MPVPTPFARGWIGSRLRDAWRILRDEGVVEVFKWIGKAIWKLVVVVIGFMEEWWRGAPFVQVLLVAVIVAAILHFGMGTVAKLFRARGDSAVRRRAVHGAHRGGTRTVTLAAERFRGEVPDLALTNDERWGTILTFGRCSPTINVNPPDFRAASSITFAVRGDIDFLLKLTLTKAERAAPEEGWLHVRAGSDAPSTSNADTLHNEWAIWVRSVSIGGDWQEIMIDLGEHFRRTFATDGWNKAEAVGFRLYHRHGDAHEIQIAEVRLDYGDT